MLWAPAAAPSFSPLRRGAGLSGSAGGAGRAGKWPGGPPGPAGAGGLGGLRPGGGGGPAAGKRAEMPVRCSRKLL